MTDLRVEALVVVLRAAHHEAHACSMGGGGVTQNPWARWAILRGLGLRALSTKGFKIKSFTIMSPRTLRLKIVWTSRCTI